MERNVTGRQVLSGVLLGLAAAAVATGRNSDVYIGRVETTKERKVREYRERADALATRIPSSGDFSQIYEARHLADRAFETLTDYCGYSDINHTCGETEVRIALDNLERYIVRCFSFERTTVVYEVVDPKTQAIQEMRAQLQNYQNQALHISDSFDRRRIASRIDNAESEIGRFDQYGRKGDYLESRARSAVQAVGSEILRCR